MTDAELSDVLTESLKTGQFKRDDLYLFDTEIAWKLSNEAHVREQQRLNTFSAIDKHNFSNTLVGHYLHSGINAQRIQREQLGDWMLTRAATVGAAAAVTEVRAFVDSGYIDIDEYLAFSGLEVLHPLSISEGIELVPMTEVPDSVLSISLVDPTWKYYGRDAQGYVRKKQVQLLSGFGKSNLYTDPHVAMAAIRLRRRMEPGLLVAPADIPNNQASMIEILGVLAATTGVAMFPVAHWTSPLPSTPLWDSLSWTYWSHQRALREFAELKGREAAVVIAVVGWQQLSQATKQKLRVPLERLNRSLAEPSPTDAAIDLGVGLEALLLGDLSPNDQISLAFRLRGAWLLGSTPAERKDLANQFNGIYSCRSKVVHGGILPSEPIKVGGQKMEPAEFICKHARVLGAKAVMRIVEMGKFPDWSELIVGA